MRNSDWAFPNHLFAHADDPMVCCLEMTAEIDSAKPKRRASAYAVKGVPWRAEPAPRLQQQMQDA